MSQWHSVANLNLSNLSIQSFNDCVASLATLPNLKSLYVNLFEEAQVDLVMRDLPELEYLNGLPVDRDALNESQNRSQQATPAQLNNEVIPEEVEEDQQDPD